jgi:hypothetical protein
MQSGVSKVHSRTFAPVLGAAEMQGSNSQQYHPQDQTSTSRASRTESTTGPIPDVLCAIFRVSALSDGYGARAMMYRKTALKRTVPSTFTYGRRAASWARVTASSLVRSAADLAEPAEFKPRTAVARSG